VSNIDGALWVRGVMVVGYQAGEGCPSILRRGSSCRKVRWAANPVGTTHHAAHQD
jgi:hypothetical protein